MSGLPLNFADFDKATEGTPDVPTVDIKPCSLNRRLKVLIAEDSLINFYVLNEYLIDAGHVVYHAEDGRKAIELADAEAFDIILMDISMPEVNGFEASREIRNGHGRNQTTPIIALTVHELEAREMKFQDAGMTGYLSKPFRRNRLLAILQDIRQGSVKPDGVASNLPRSKIIAIFTPDLTST